MSSRMDIRLGKQGDVLFGHKDSVDWSMKQNAEGRKT